MRCQYCDNHAYIDVLEKRSRVVNCLFPNEFLASKVLLNENK